MASSPRLSPSETQKFLSELQNYVDIRVWDDISPAFYEFIEVFLDAFPEIGDSGIRLAQTSSYYKDQQEIPPLEIWFRIDETTGKLQLLGVTLENDTTLDDEFVW